MKWVLAPTLGESWGEFDNRSVKTSGRFGKVWH